MKNIAWLLALILLLGACSAEFGTEAATTTGADSTTDETGSDAEGSPDSESSSDDDAANAADDDDSGDSGDSAAGDGSAGDSSGVGGSGDDDSDDGAASGDISSDDDQAATADPADGELPPDSALGFILAAIGTEPTDEIVSCIEGEGADPLTGFDASEDEATAISLASIRCLDDELAAFGASTYPPTPGVESDDVECVLLEAYRYMGELSQDEAAAAIDAPDLPPEIEAEILDRATSRCDVTEEVAADILDFLAS